MLSPGPSVRKISKGKGRKKRYSQPQDIREGMTNAYHLVKEVRFENKNVTVLLIPPTSFLLFRINLLFFGIINK